ncbi:MAG: hypothetical protein GXP40_06020 [Chloroflexi bacterium]|nr:hypothetical protein [Chloroflexota bacterium]
MSESGTPKGTLSSMLFGGIFFLMGSFVVLVAADIIHTDPGSIHAPRWVLAAAGGLFMFAGMTIALQGAFSPGAQQTALYQWLQYFLVLGILVSFSFVFIWIGLGPGEREFSSSSSIGPITVSGSGDDLMGRCMFGGFGLLMGAGTLWYAISRLLRILGGRPDKE